MKNIAVIGSGTMGNGIAHVFAQYDYKVSLIDISEEALTKAIKNIDSNLDRMIAKQTITEADKERTLSNISTHSSMKLGVQDCELAIEAVSENINLKLKIFKDLDEFCKPSCILASNTSSISISQIGAVTKRGDKVIGMHFMNPVPMMKLVEVIRGYLTSDKVCTTINELSVRIGKIPCEVQDYPGFISNRVLIPMINEAIFALHERVSNVRDIDMVMRFGMNHPMGPLQLADFIGLDVVLDILNVLHDGFKNPKYAPCPLLVNMVRAGHLGKKTGSGFYKYKDGSKDLVMADHFRHW
jgi:3-hydroxybutyryl-CoA dehydrogenase